MTERIDHAAQALRYLPATGDGMNTGRIAVAQVHATLALVEQQRIANLIVLAIAPGNGTLEVAAARTLLDVGGASVIGVRPEIREALGLA